MPRANWSVLVESLIPIPPAGVLTRINNFIVDAAEAAAVYHAISLRSSSARDLLLPRLISGELSVTAAEREIEQAAYATCPGTSLASFLSTERKLVEDPAIELMEN